MKRSNLEKAALIQALHSLCYLPSAPRRFDANEYIKKYTEVHKNVLTMHAQGDTDANIAEELKIPESKVRGIIEMGACK